MSPLALVVGGLVWVAISVGLGLVFGRMVAIGSPEVDG